MEKLHKQNIRGTKKKKKKRILKLTKTTCLGQQDGCVVKINMPYNPDYLNLILGTHIEKAGCGSECV